MLLNFYVSFHGIIAHFFQMLNNRHFFLEVPVYSLTEGHHCASMFLTIISKSAIHICVQVSYIDINVQLLWVNTKEGDCWILLEEC